MNHDDVIDTLNDLIETSKDGEYGFVACAEHMSNANTKQLFVRRAAECRAAAAELQALVVRLGGSAEDSGSVAGAAHRGWVAVRARLPATPTRQFSKKPSAVRTLRWSAIALPATRCCRPKCAPWSTGSTRG
jgi:hypothetical protein